MAAPWTLNLLGRFQLVAPDGAEKILTSKKTMGLLAALALAPGQALTREQVVALLWGDRGPDQARSSLRQTIVTLRKEFEKGALTPPFLDVDGEVLRLAPGAVSVDALDLGRMAAARSEEELRQAGSLWRGEFLEGLLIAGEAFESWVRGERDRLRSIAMGVWRKLAEVGPAAQRVAAAKQLVALDPLHEQSHAVLMEAFVAAGDVPGALRQFEACRALLKQELGVEPGKALAELRQSLTAAAAAAPADQGAARPGKGKPSIAVLPFDNLNGEPEQRYFSDAIAEDILNGLSRFSTLFVIARHSSFRFRDGSADVPSIARQLGVRYLVTGSVRKGGGRVRITAQLVDSADGKQLWSGRFDRPLADLFDVQDEVTQLVVSSLTGRIEHVEIRQAMTKPTESLQAYDCLLCGIELLRSYGENVNRRAISLFEKAIALDPNYGLAHGYLALALLVEHGFENAPAAIRDRALRHARLGVKLAPDDARCHQYLGDAYLYSRQHDLALGQYERGIALNPNDANALIRYAYALAVVGRAEEGLELAHRAIRNNPFHPDYYWSDVAVVAYAARHYEEALTAGLRVAVHGGYWPKARVAACLAQLGRMDEARNLAADVLRLKPDFSLAHEDLSYKFAADAEHVKNGMRKAGLPD